MLIRGWFIFKANKLAMVHKSNLSDQGMQRNPGCKTIEAELEQAIHKAGGISDDNAGDFVKVVRVANCFVNICMCLRVNSQCILWGR